MIKFEEMVKALEKPPEDILNTMTAKQMSALHMSVGVSGESGELLDAIKKYAIYNKPLDRINVVEELGDIEFYLEGLRTALGINRQECIQANIEKLGVRYASGSYSDQQAQDRADKQISLVGAEND